MSHILFQVISYVLEWDGDQPGYLVPVALCVNLALNSRCAELMCDQDNLQRLMSRAFHLQDSILLKIIRNISTHQAIKHLLIVSLFMYIKFSLNVFI